LTKLLPSKVWGLGFFGTQCITPSNSDHVHDWLIVWLAVLIVISWTSWMTCMSSQLVTNADFSFVTFYTTFHIICCSLCDEILQSCDSRATWRDLYSPLL